MDSPRAAPARSPSTAPTPTPVRPTSPIVRCRSCLLSRRPPMSPAAPSPAPPTPKQLKVKVALAPVPLKWNGLEDQTTWEKVVSGKLNWTNGTSNTYYGEPALVPFNDTAPANATNITLNTSVSPASATFNSET